MGSQRVGHDWATELNERNQRWHKQIDSPCSWVGRINIVKMTILPNTIYRFSVIPIKLSMAFFTELEQKISQFIWNSPNSQNGLEKEKWSWRNQPYWLQIILQRYSLQIILQSYSHQDSMVLAQKQKYRPMEQDIKPRNKPMHPWAPIFNKGGKNIQWSKDSLFNKWCWENWTATC